ncbi:MAG: hypothetical protein P8J30_02235 [Ilumatobacter sp.]|nr:hypothetical protein [Ilumatobacter sp.]
MAGKNDFDSHEWQLLLAMPWIAGILVVVADRSWRVIGEFKAMAAAVSADGPHGAASTMIEELLADMEGSIDPDEADDGKSEEEMFGTLEQCGELIAARCTADEAKDLRKWVLGIARATAEARREGGFLGIGSVRVSDDEQSALSRIDAAISATG